LHATGMTEYHLYEYMELTLENGESYQACHSCRSDVGQS